jgi:transposase
MIFALFGTKFCRGIGVGKMGCSDAYEYVVDFLKWLRENHYPDLNRPLHFVLDNARYQHCAYVRQEAAKLGIVLEFQPSYSPNLNLIERAWKYFKKLVGRCYYSTKEEFFAAIISILDKTDETQHQECFTTLLTMNFQTYKKSQILGG